MTGICAIVLAAGNSHRFGTLNKLLVEIDGLALIRKLAEELVLGAKLEVVVVTGSDRVHIERILADLPLSFAHNEHWSAGMGSSIATGAASLGSHVQGALVVPGDMPFLTAPIIKTLLFAFGETERASIIVPVAPAGGQRNPVLWPRRFFPQLRALDGPTGGKGLLKRSWAQCRTVKFDDDSAFRDVDTEDDLARLRLVAS